MSTRIQEVRVSFVWFERWGDIWSSANPIAMEFLRTSDGYEKEFDSVIQETVIGPSTAQPIPAARLQRTGLTAPWPIKQEKSKDYPNWFWLFYLGKRPLRITGALALSKLTPFHVGFDARIKPQSKYLSLIYDGFVYPHGIAVVLKLVLTLDGSTFPVGGLQTGPAMSNILSASTQELYTITRTGSPPIVQELPALADTLLDDLRNRVLGTAATAGDRSLRPFIVAGIVRGDTDFTETAPPQDGEIHRMLQGMSSLSTNWAGDKLAPMDKAKLTLRDSAPKGDLLYHTSRGRAMWFPSSFTEKGPFIRRAGCYHRNLTMLSLQAQALLQSLASRQDVLEKATKAPAFLEQMAKDAAQELSLLYSSGDDTYRSSSVRAYLDETPSQKKLLEGALADFGMEKLNYTKW